MITAFPLFDLFAASKTTRSEGDMHREQQLLTVATNMVAGAVQEFEKLRELDEKLATPIDVGDPRFDLDTAITIRLMYEEAANDAERILSRIDPLERDLGHIV